MTKDIDVHGASHVPLTVLSDDEQLFRESCRSFAEGRIKPLVSATYPIERAGDAIAALGNRTAIGKLVVTLD